jgi:hypothetical protein
MPKKPISDTARERVGTVPLAPSTRREMSVRRLVDKYGDPLDKLAAASAAGDLKATIAILPYIYPALKAVEVTGAGGDALRIEVVKISAVPGVAG